MAPGAGGGDREGHERLGNALFCVNLGSCVSITAAGSCHLKINSQSANCTCALQRNHFYRLRDAIVAAAATGYKHRAKSFQAHQVSAPSSCHCQLSLLSDCCCECRGISDQPSRQALWSTTSKGDIMVHEPSFSLETTTNALPADLM